MKAAWIQIKIGLWRGLGIFLCVGTLTALSAIIAQQITTFQSGQVVSASAMNENFQRLNTDIQRMPPVGAIIAWHKNLPGVTSTLPDGWVECNGQVINDAASALNGQIAPNLNGDMSGADSPGTAGQYAMFLRGGTISGTGQLDAFQGHHHNNISALFDAPGDLHIDANFTGGGIWWNRIIQRVRDPITGNHGGVRVDTETRPVNMTVVWILRIK